MDSEKASPSFAQAWSHFTFYTRQRSRLMMFAAGLAAVFAIGIALLLSGSAPVWIILPLGVFVTLLGALLGLLDNRWQLLAHSSSRALQALDASLEYGGCKKESGGASRPPPFTLFTAIYTLIVMEGLYFSALPFYLPKPTPPPTPPLSTPRPTPARTIGNPYMGRSITPASNPYNRPYPGIPGAPAHPRPTPGPGFPPMPSRPMPPATSVQPPGAPIRPIPPASIPNPQNTSPAPNPAPAAPGTPATPAPK